MNTFGSRSILSVGKDKFEIYKLASVEKHGVSIGHLPYSLRILLENLLRREDGKAVKADDIRALTSLERQERPGTGDRVYAGARANAGFYRSTRRC